MVKIVRKYAHSWTNVDPNEIKSEEEVLADIKKIIWEYDGNLKHLKKEYFDEHLHSKGGNVQVSNLHLG